MEHICKTIPRMKMILMITDVICVPQGPLSQEKKSFQISFIVIGK